MGRIMKITTPKGYVIELTTDEAEALFPELVHDLRRQLLSLIHISEPTRPY